MTHPLFLLAIVTFVVVIGFFYWSRRSAKRHAETGGHTAGIGGPNDPLSGATPGMRHPDAMRASLDQPSGLDDVPPPPGQR